LETGRLRCRAIVPLLFFSLLSQESPEAPYLVRTTSLRSSRLGSKTRSLAKRPIDRAGDLLAGPGSYRAAQRRLPLFGCHRRLVEPEIREHRGLINVASDLLGATPGGDVLSARQLRAPAGAREAQEVLHHQRHRPPRTLRPRRVRGRLDDDLADDPPARVVGVAAGYEEPRERLGHAYGLWLGPVTVEVSQRRTHAAAVVDRLGELTRGPSRLACFIVDRSTVLAENLGSARVEARIEEGGHGGAAALDRGAHVHGRLRDAELPPVRGRRPRRGELVAEALRLGRALAGLMPDEPEAHGLVAMMLLLDARRAARFWNGDLVLLADQDHSLWDTAQISDGRAVLERRLAELGKVSARSP
jgi:hypothetical protein